MSCRTAPASRASCGSCSCRPCGMFPKGCNWKPAFRIARFPSTQPRRRSPQRGRRWRMWRVCGSRRWLRCFRIGCWCWKGRVPPIDGRHARGGDPARRGRTRPRNFPESRLSSKIYLSCPMASEEELEAALQGLYYKWGGLGYWARRFYQKFSRHCKRYVGGVQAVRSVLPFQTPGFIFLKEHGRLDLSVEALLLTPEWKGLFTDEDRAIAREKLSR